MRKGEGEKGKRGKGKGSGRGKEGEGEEKGRDVPPTLEVDRRHWYFTCCIVCALSDNLPAEYGIHQLDKTEWAIQV